MSTTPPWRVHEEDDTLIIVPKTSSSRREWLDNKKRLEELKLKAKQERIQLLLGGLTWLFDAVETPAILGCHAGHDAAGEHEDGGRVVGEHRGDGTITVEKEGRRSFKWGSRTEMWVRDQADEAIGLQEQEERVFAYP